ncbi:hypothetical protein B0T11DRAFT_13115 [Plectosphaerella cucumerina]|uniref:Secreted protein n=1 Tax=Plectosphaerella cucumerina TaxID=40658 RepID=A0A8K0TNY7_9PEZI|nr:hypothetical protein B0T11DRAFT_13115 [Plectosphaerella cucumerina]
MTWHLGAYGSFYLLRFVLISPSRAFLSSRSEHRDTRDWSNLVAEQCGEAGSSSIGVGLGEEKHASGSCRERWFVWQSRRRLRFEAAGHGSYKPLASRSHATMNM